MPPRVPALADGQRRRFERLRVSRRGALEPYSLPAGPGGPAPRSGLPVGSATSWLGGPPPAVPQTTISGELGPSVPVGNCAVQSRFTTEGAPTIMPISAPPP